MQAFVHPILELLDGNSQYIVPRYQRAYSWRLEQCRQLWQDITELAKHTQAKHFLGSVVYVQESSGGAAGGATYQVIDGQQRLTTLTLLLAALAGALEERENQQLGNDNVSASMVRELFIKNRPGEQRFKLLLSRDDKETLMHVLDPAKVPVPQIASARVLENHKFFSDLLNRKEADLEGLYQTLWRLVVVDISLERQQDNPQLIFESLNSTGMDLTQSDLTRNYVLMSLPAAQQAELYDHYWHPMEGYFKGQLKKKRSVFDFFVRDFLTVRRELSQSPQLEDVYAAFKRYIQDEHLSASMDEVVRDMHQMAAYYAALVNPSGYEQDVQVRQALMDLQGMELDVWLPVGLHAYEAWKNEVITREDFIRTLRTIESYLFRRWATELPSAGLNKVFPALIPQLRASEYVLSLQDALYQLPGTRRFPTDEEFSARLGLRDLYSARSWTRYTLGKLEQGQNKEFAGVADYTIEHIMPQNEKPSAEWQAMLGEHWQAVQDKYLHTLGNLTLTKYNSELSDRPFAEKRDMNGGFKDTGLRISKSLRELETWNEEAILQRAASLSAEALKVWPALEPSATLKEKLASRQQARSEQSVEAFLVTASPALRELYEQVRDGILELHAEMQELPVATYIAYKVGTNITDIVPQPGNEAIKATLNLPFAELNDPQEWATDVSGKGKHGNGEAEVILRSPLDIPAYLELVQQALDYQLVRKQNTGESRPTVTFSSLTPAAREALEALEQRCQASGVTSRDNKRFRGFYLRRSFLEVYPRQGRLHIAARAEPDENEAGQWSAYPSEREWHFRAVHTLEDLEQAWPLIQRAREAAL